MHYILRGRVHSSQVGGDLDNNYFGQTLTIFTVVTHDNLGSYTGNTVAVYICSNTTEHKSVFPNHLDQHLF